MATIASLAVNLIAQTNRFTQPLKTAERAVQSFQGSVDKVSQGLERVQSLTGKAATRFLALKAAITLATRQATQYAGAVIAVHQQTGILIESVQGLRFAAQQSSTDISTLEIGLRSLARRAAEASQGNASFAKGFERFGVNVQDASGALKDVETILMGVADGAAAMATEADASAALMLVMGDAGRRLVPFMRQGSEGIRDLMDQAVRLGIVMDENAIRALDALGSEIGITGNRIGALTRDLSYRASPAVGVMVGWVNQLIDGFFDLSDEQRQQIVRWTAYAGMLLGAATAVGLLARVLAAGTGILRTFGMIATVAFNPLTLKLAAVGALVALAIARFDELKAWWENSDFGQIVRNAWTDLEETWLSDELTLPQKTLKTVSIVVETVTDLVESIITWFAKQTIDLAKTVAVALLPEDHALVTLLTELETIWDNSELTFAEKVVQSIRLIPGGSPVADFIEKLRTVWNDEELTFKEKVIQSLQLIPGSKVISDFVTRLQQSWIGRGVTLAVDAAIELGGAMYDAIKKGFETGDWSDAFVVGADIWRTGVLIAVSLALAANAASAILSSIQLGLGLSTAGLAGLGVPGAIGALSIVVALAEAQAAGDYTKFGKDLVAALAAGIGIGIFTGSPYAGALAFTIVMNFEVGSWIGDKLKEVRDSLNQPGAFEAFAERPSLSDLLTIGQVSQGPVFPSVEPVRPSLPLPDNLLTPDASQRMIEEATGIVDATTSVTDAVRIMADEYSYLETMLPTESLEQFMLTLGTMESGLANVVNGLSSARGEFQLLEFARSAVEKTLGEIDWTDPMDRTKAAFEWLRMGLENEFGTIAEAAERLGITIEESLHLWWVMGGPALRQAQTLDAIATRARLPSGAVQDVTAAEILRRRARIPGFQSGTPWTGWGAPDEVAGIVHMREAVIPWDVLRRGPAAVLEFLGAPGFQEGRYEGIMQAPLFGAGAARQQEQITATLVVSERGLAHSLVERLRPVLEGIFPGLTDALLSGLDTLASGMEFAREKLDELMTALEEGPQAIEAAVNALNDMKPAVDDLIVSLTSDRIARLDDLVEIERLLAHVTGQAFDETAFRARELSRAISDTARTMFEAGRSAKEVSEVIAPWVEQLEPLSRELERQQTTQAAVSAAMQTLASRLEDVNSGIASFVRTLRYEAGRVSLDMQSLIADAMSFFVGVVVDLFDTGQAELKQRISSVPDPGTDVLSVARAFGRYRDIGANIRERESALRDLYSQQRAITERTAGGAAAGAALGAVIGSIIPGVGTILGGLLGGLFGGSSAKKKAQQDLGPQIQATEEKIRELERLIHNARVDLIDALGIAADDFASSIMSAFSAQTANEFGERLGESVRNQIRHAMTQVFVAEILEPQITALAEMVQAAFLDGGPLDVAEIDARIESIVEISSQLYDRFEELGLGVKKTNEQFRAMTVNIPLGRRALEAIRFQSATPQSVLSLYSGPELAALSQQSGGDMIFTGSITVVANDPADFERQLRQYMRRESLRRTGNPAALERVRR